MDEYNLALLRRLKSAETDDYHWLRGWWGERCGLDDHYVRDHDIAEHLVLLVEKLSARGPHWFFVATMPTEQWKYGMEDIPTSHAAPWLRAACSALRGMPADALPGFRAYMEKYPHKEQA